jgi:hypothetical protein
MMFVSKTDLIAIATETNTGFEAVYQELRELREEIKLLKEMTGVSVKRGRPSKEKEESQENT